MQNKRVNETNEDREKSLVADSENSASTTGAPTPNRRRGPRRGWTSAAVAILIGVAVGAALALIPVPMVVYRPGPTFDVLGQQDGQDIISIPGQQSSDIDADRGELRMVTVSEMGGPGYSVTTMNLIQAWFNPAYSVYRYSDLYAPEVTEEDVSAANTAQMTSSHSTSAVAALTYLDYAIPTVITIEGIAEDGPAWGEIEEGDVLLSLQAPNGPAVPMVRPDAPFTFLNGIPPGTLLQVTVMRDDVEVTVPVRTYLPADSPESTQGTKLGVVLSFDVEMPLEIDFNLERIGGPSAGMIFALAIIDELQGGNMTGGKSIAGTGTISYDGQVGPIGGIVQKMYGAERDGSTWFLAPTGNCQQVAGNIPRGLNVAAVSTLTEAVEAVEAIGRDQTAYLLTCDAYLAEQSPVN